MFSDAGPDVRWIGNERGVAGETNWSTIRPESVPFIGAGGDEVMQALQEGHPDGAVWRPGETDVSIRPGWFHHAAEDPRVKTVDDLVALYFTSVGRNSKLLLNVPTTRDGQLHGVDVMRLASMRTALERQFSAPHRPSSSTWRTTGAMSGERTVVFSAPVSLSVLDLQETIADGQRVSAWTLSAPGNSAPLAQGTTIGYRQLRRLAPTTVTGLTLRVETVEAPRPVTLRTYG
jgi:alpha-L-fucosidase